MNIQAALLILAHIKTARNAVADLQYALEHGLELDGFWAEDGEREIMKLADEVAELEMLWPTADLVTELQSTVSSHPAHRVRRCTERVRYPNITLDDAEGQGRR